MGKSIRKPAKRKKTAKKSSIGCLFWFVLILLIIIVFMAYHPKLDSIFKNIDIFDKFTKKDEKALVIEDMNSPGNKKNIVVPNKAGVKKEDSKETVIKIGDKVVPPENKTEKKTETVKQGDNNSLRESFLYFVSISENGDISLNKVNRKVFFSGSPLYATIKSLLEGLTTDELNKGMISLIPDGTKIKSIRVDEGIAFMDFSEDFMFNTFGSEGTKTQLKQVVYTATEFPTVKSVQILIDGKKVKYLCEGVYTEKPISRDFF